jgi:hypothetical protein
MRKRQEERNNNVKLRKTRKLNKKDSPIISMNGARSEMLKSTI